MKKEINIFLLLFGLFVFFYFMPVESTIFSSAILSGFVLLHEYARMHVLTCLVPAFFIAGAISVFIKKDIVLKYLGGETKKVLSYTIASVSGGILAVCSCTILPLFAGIRKRGAGLGPAITFLFSGPAINIAAMFLTISVLGMHIGIARILSAILLSILVGLSMQAIFREKTEEGGLFVEESKQTQNTVTIVIFMLSMVAVLVVNGLQIDDPTLKYFVMITLALIAGVIALKKFPKKINIEWMKETWSFAKTLLPLLFIGVFVAGFVMTFLPKELVQSIVGSNTFVANLFASVFGAFMYFSTLTEVPILQELIAKGMNGGPALALLLAGPALSLPNMLVVRGVLGTKKTAVYVALVVLYSSITGFLYGSII